MTSSGLPSGGSGYLWVIQQPDSSATSGLSMKFTAAESFSFGGVGRINSNGTVSGAINTTINTASGLVLCTLDSVYAGYTVEWLVYGVANSPYWSWTTGGIIYLSTNGTMTQTVPTGTDVAVQILGIALSPTKIFFNPQLVQVELA